MSSEFASGNNGSTPRAKSAVTQRLIVVGYILAVAMPPLGFAVGLVLIFQARVRSRHGAWIVLLSIGAAVIWVLLMSSGALTSVNQGY